MVKKIEIGDWVAHKGDKAEGEVLDVFDHDTFDTGPHKLATVRWEESNLCQDVPVAALVYAGED